MFCCVIDVGTIFHKLFDHRTAMHAEHQFFVKEFEVSAPHTNTSHFYKIESRFFPL